MNKHCKRCKLHHNANHPAHSVLAKKYNDWCCVYGKAAKKAKGECVLKGGKVLDE